MNIKRFALIGGSIMLAMGILALIPALSTSPVDGNLKPLELTAGYGAFLGFFPMNIINKLALIIFGAVGILSAISVTRSLPASIQFSRAVLYVMGPLAILGLIPATSTLFGYWPLYSGEVLAHGIFAILGGYFGFSLTTRAEHALKERFPEKDKADVTRIKDVRDRRSA